MNNYENKYFEIGTVIIHVKQMHDQTSVAIALVEVDDYVGNIHSFNTNVYTLKNYSKMFECSYLSMTKWVEVTKYNFESKLIQELGKSIDEIKRGIGFCRTDFKQTTERMKVLRNHYGKKP